MHKELKGGQYRSLSALVFQNGGISLGAIKCFISAQVDVGDQKGGECGLCVLGEKPTRIHSFSKIPLNYFLVLS